MNVQKQLTSIEQIRDQISAQPVKTKGSTDAQTSKTFETVLNDTANQIKFSKHASQRLQTRQIDMSQEQKERLQDAASQARQKGMKESLVMVDNLAFIVNVRSNTVVTAVNDTEQAVFTNIDGAIIN
jgi:flagellar operon protein